MVEVSEHDNTKENSNHRELDPSIGVANPEHGERQPGFLPSPPKKRGGMSKKRGDWGKKARHGKFQQMAIITKFEGENFLCGDAFI